MQSPDKLLDGLKIGHLRKELKSIRKEYYKPLGKMNRAELLAEHGRHKGLMAGKVSEPESSMVDKVVKPSVNVEKKKVIPGLPQAMGTAVGAKTQEGGKALGGEPKKRRTKLIETEGGGMVGVPNVHDLPKTKKSTKKSAPEPASDKGSADKAQPTGTKKVSAYNSFVGKHRREGKSMKDIAEMWRSHK
jgi:hypothetical protein